MVNYPKALISLSFIFSQIVTAKEIQVTIPAHDDKRIFTARNIAIIAMTLAIAYIAILMVQVCFKKHNSDSDSERTDSYISNSSLYEEGYTSEYTNSQYLRSDNDNSLVDHQNFKYDQSLKNESSRENSDNDNAQQDMFNN